MRGTAESICATSTPSLNPASSWATFDLGLIDRCLQFIWRHVWVTVPKTRTQPHQPRVQFLQLPKCLSRPSRVLLEQLHQVTLKFSDHGLGAPGFSQLLPHRRQDDRFCGIAPKTNIVSAGAPVEVTRTNVLDAISEHIVCATHLAVHQPAQQILDRTAYITRASLNVSLGANSSIALGYGGEIADDYSQHEVNLSLRIAW